MIKLPDDFLYVDIRGRLRATKFLGQRDEGEGVPFKPAQMVVVHNNPGVFRGFHFQTRAPMRKAVLCLDGLIRDFAIDMKTGALRQEVLTRDTNGVLIEAHEAHGYYSPGKSTLVYFYDRPFLEDKQGGINPLKFLRQAGIVAVVSDKDTQWPEWTPPKPKESPSSPVHPTPNMDELINH